MADVTPLTPAEQAELRERADRRITSLEDKMAGVFEFRRVAEPPHMVNSAPTLVRERSRDHPR